MTGVPGIHSTRLQSSVNIHYACAWSVSVVSQIDRTEVGQATVFVVHFGRVTNHDSVLGKHTESRLRRLVLLSG